MLNLTPTQLFWETPIPLLNAWWHAYLYAEGVDVKRAHSTSDKPTAKIDRLMADALRYTN